MSVKKKRMFLLMLLRHLLFIWKDMWLDPYLTLYTNMNNKFIKHPNVQGKTRKIIYLFIYFCWSCMACRIFVPRPGLNLHPRQWKCSLNQSTARESPASLISYFKQPFPPVKEISAQCRKSSYKNPVLSCHTSKKKIKPTHQPPCPETNCLCVVLFPFNFFGLYF